MYFPETDFEDESCGGSYSPFKFTNKSRTISELPLYPNPATNEITVGMSFPEYENLHVQVRNNMSQIEKIETRIDANGQIKIDISPLNEGLYYLQIITENGVLKTGTFIKIK